MPAVKNVAPVRKSVHGKPKLSIPRPSQELCLSQSLVCRILRKDLELHPVDPRALAQRSSFASKFCRYVEFTAKGWLLLKAEGKCPQGIGGGMMSLISFKATIASSGILGNTNLLVPFVCFLRYEISYSSDSFIFRTFPTYHFDFINFSFLRNASFFYGIFGCAIVFHDNVEHIESGAGQSGGGGVWVSWDDLDAGARHPDTSPPLSWRLNHN
ncbi:unnamed protein product [Brassicogethes aeneus]|uniref:Uncharacterized protein n=1 Tax=Brassicogethes aeneus TaxID=1431903 RepID=A0A9P0B403_BRAAE|nr:unnamed protein product [Brassicogethes aeneus]